MSEPSRKIDASLRSILHSAIQHGVSDVHIKPHSPARLRLNGVLLPTEMPSITAEDSVRMIRSTMGDAEWEAFLQKQERDYSVEDPKLGRYRVNAYVSRGDKGMVLRRLPDAPPILEHLGIPLPVSHLAHEQNGLILVCGATGSGKSTTLAGLVNIINHSRNVHIITIEDPIEYIHVDDKSSILQREVGTDTASFGNALHSALRQDPDVILLGEMRDEETVRTALSASETGHLVLSTLHATSASEAIGRFLDFFPQGERQAARATLAESLRGVICQRLVPHVSGTSRRAVVEILLNKGRTRETILDSSKNDINDIIANGASWGMQTFDDHLYSLVSAGEISPETAQSNSSNRQDMSLRLRSLIPR